MSDLTLQRKAKRKLNGKFLRYQAFSWALVLPALLFLAFFTFYPMCNLIHLSLYRGNITNPYKTFRGIQNYVDIFFTRPQFLTTLKNTAFYALMYVPICLSLSVIFAVWLQKSRKINNFAQTCFFTPHLVATICSAFMWSWIFSPEASGIMNSVIKILGFNSHNWLGSSSTAMICVMVMNTWSAIGHHALIFLSAIKSIPGEIYEAAELDNSNSVKTFFKITLPMISPQIFMMLITMTTNSFKVFESVRKMTGGGPGISTKTVCMFIYDNAFETNNTLGLGAAASIALMIILMLITLLDFKGLEKKVHYQ